MCNIIFLLSVSCLIIISEYIIFPHGVMTFFCILLVYMPPPEHVSSNGEHQVPNHSASPIVLIV